jgi:hypothetical protein
LLKTKENVITPEFNADALMTTEGATVSVVSPPPPQALISTEAARAHAVRVKVFANLFIG